MLGFCPDQLNRDQQYASRAFACVEARGTDSEYASFAKSFPALIHKAGLCQAVGFAYSKGQAGRVKEPKVHFKLLEDLVKTMDVTGYESAEELHKKVSEVGVAEYMRLTEAAMRGSGWLKRYCEALIPKAAGEVVDGDA